MEPLFVHHKHYMIQLLDRPLHAFQILDFGVVFDKITFHTILASISESIPPLIVTSSTTRDAWLKIQRLYANQSWTHVMQLKEEFFAVTARMVSIHYHNYHKSRNLQHLHLSVKEPLLTFGTRVLVTPPTKSVFL